MDYKHSQWNLAYVLTQTTLINTSKPILPAQTHHFFTLQRNSFTSTPIKIISLHAKKYNQIEFWIRDISNTLKLTYGA